MHRIISHIIAWFYFRCPPLWAFGVRYYCPLPSDGNYTARQCVEAGVCGCDNRHRYE